MKRATSVISNPVGRLVAYLLLVGVVALGFRADYYQDREDERDDDERLALIEKLEDLVRQTEFQSKMTDFSLCTSQNQARGGIRDFVQELIALGNQSQPPSEFDQRILALAEEDFAPINCPPEPVRE